MKKLFLYWCLCLIDIVIGICVLSFLVDSFVDVSYFGVIVWSIFFFVGFNDFINRHRKFMRFFPLFDEKWLTGFIW
jgi:hypothetical protein